MSLNSKGVRLTREQNALILMPDLTVTELAPEGFIHSGLHQQRDRLACSIKVLGFSDRIGTGDAPRRLMHAHACSYRLAQTDHQIVVIVHNIGRVGGQYDIQLGDASDFHDVIEELLLPGDMQGSRCRKQIPPRGTRYSEVS